MWQPGNHVALQPCGNLATSSSSSIATEWQPGNRSSGRTAQLVSHGNRSSCRMATAARVARRSSCRMATMWHSNRSSGRTAQLGSPQLSSVATMWHPTPPKCNSESRRALHPIPHKQIPTIKTTFPCEPTPFFFAFRPPGGYIFHLWKQCLK